MSTASSLASLLLLLAPPERPTVLPDSLRSGEPALLLPVFTRCTGTCPMTAVYLKRALDVPFRVIVFSFDETDTDDDLRDFRERFDLPREWTIVRWKDGAATRKFLDSLDFHFMKTGSGFDHPNTTFVFSAEGRWAATLNGSSFTSAELRLAHDRALHAYPWLLRPEAWIVLACGGFALSVAVLLTRRKGDSLKGTV